MTDVFERIRAACAEVAARARFVRIDEARLAARADALLRDPPPPPTWDARYHHVGSPESTLAFVVTWNAVNFGSGWFPVLRKRAGLSGSLTIVSALKDRFDARGAWSAAELADLRAETLAPVLGQDLAQPEVAELVGLFAQALRDLGGLLRERYDGRFEALVGAAGGSAARLVDVLAAMPFYRDVARFDGTDGLEVPLYKRAQITAADLALAFDGRGPGAFADLDRLTIFADNLVPHVLRCEGVLVYEESLAGRIAREELLAPGSREEVEIRACGLHAVERLVALVRARGGAATARHLDYVLWNRGQSPAIKATPRHRARSVYY